MPSPEHSWNRLTVFGAPDKPRSDSSGSISNPQSPLENSLASTEQIQTEEAQEALQAVGLVAQSFGRGRKRIDLPTEEIAAQYCSSIPVTELAQQHGVSRGTIYKRLHEVGLPQRDSQDKPSSDPNRQVASESVQHPEEQYKQWLRNNHPELTEEVIEQAAQHCMETNLLRGTILLMAKLDQIMRQKRPDWEWPRWFERKMAD